MDYSEWDRGQPEGGLSQNCLILAKHAGWTWHDAPCSWKHGYICEMYM